MAEYAKKKNDELAALCKERGLAHTGKKAELVKRLEDHDAQSGNGTVDANGSGGDGNATQSVPTTATSKPAADTSDKVAPTAPQSTVADSKAETASKPADETNAPSEEFTLGLEERTLDDEIAKRKKRAEKFGIDISQDETLKLLERAKRFGSNNVPGLLNKALPERAEKTKKRGREGRDEREERKQSRPRGNNEQPRKEQKEATSDGFPSWMTSKDREAAERRKAKYTSTE